MTTTEAPPGARIYGAVSEDTRRAQRELRERQAKPREETNTMTAAAIDGVDHQNQLFWNWARKGEDQEASAEYEAEIAKLGDLTKALAEMAKQAKVQPAHGDKIHAVQRVAQMAANIGSAADVLAASMESGE